MISSTDIAVVAVIAVAAVVAVVAVVAVIAVPPNFFGKNGPTTALIEDLPQKFRTDLCH